MRTTRAWTGRGTSGCLQNFAPAPGAGIVQRQSDAQWPFNSAVSGYEPANPCRRRAHPGPSRHRPGALGDPRHLEADQHVRPPKDRSEWPPREWLKSNGLRLMFRLLFLRALRTAMPQFNRRRRRFNAEAQRFAENRRGFFFSAFLRAFSALLEVRLFAGGDKFRRVR